MKTIRELGIEATVSNLKETVFSNVRPYAKKYEEYEDFYASENVQQWIRQSQRLNPDAAKLCKSAIRQAAFDAWNDVTE